MEQAAETTAEAGEASSAAKAAKSRDASRAAESSGVAGMRGNDVAVFPYLVFKEFLAALLISILLLVWSLAINAPLLPEANPGKTDNPAKAPWYFVGLQELLVYFDPWIAGVAMPTLIIVGLMVIPYVDINPKGNGYYTVRERPFAMSVFLFGFLVLWISLIAIGTFLRGPGWYFFAPWQYWDPHKVVALTNVDWSYLWCKWLHLPPTALVDDLIGGLTVCFYIFVVPVAGWLLLKKWSSDVAARLGAVRYAIVATLFLAMMSLPIKMILRWTLNVKYIWTCCGGTSLINF